MRSHCFVVVGRAIGARRGIGFACTAALALAGAASSAHAHLGGFEAADGYQPFLNMVQHYNAGQYGPSSGYLAMSPSAITPNTGLWRAIAGGASDGMGGVSYVTGHQFYDRQWVNNGIGTGNEQGLVITTNHEGWGGSSLRYEYDLDSQDLGVAPAATANGSVKTSFWVRGQLAGPEAGGQIADGFYGNEIAFMDSLGNVGASFGLTQRAGGDTVTYWDGTQMFESTIIGAGGRFDRWDITIDLISDTFSADYYQFLSNTTTNVVSGAPLMLPLADLTMLRFTSSPGVNNSKLWAVDDFSFETRLVPAPASLGLLVGAAVLAGRRRR